MDVQQMLKCMCHEVLSTADIKAIVKSRGFSSREATSRALFENFFLSPKGVESALGSLSRDEVVLLHLLRFIDEAVDITFFDRIYGEGDSRIPYYVSFNERYKGVFKKLKTSLIRKGVLLIAEHQDQWDAKTKMERWRFRFPHEFEGFLPSPFGSTGRFNVSGDFRKDVLRRKLMEIIKVKSSLSQGEDNKHNMTLTDGRLCIGDREFRARYLLEWQRSCWEASVKSAKKQKKGALSSIKAVFYAFSQLGQDEWIVPDELKGPLNVFCHGARVPGCREICEAGWEWGCLVKHVTDGKTYYRLPDNPDTVDVDPATYLTINGDVSVTVDLETIPYDCLELVSGISEMNVLSSSLHASPHLIRIGRAPGPVWSHPLFPWLRKNSPAFRKVIETVNKRRGRHVIHENLMLARVRDLSLKVRIEKAFPDPKRLIMLPNDYIAFPRGMFEDIQRLLNKSGHVIKRVELKSAARAQRRT